MDLARAHKIQSLPTFKIFRRAAEAASKGCIATVIGGGKAGSLKLAEEIQAHLTAEEKALVQRHNGPDSAREEITRLTATLATSDEEIQRLATTPLAEIDLEALSNAQSRSVPLRGELPFDLRAHPAARSLVAKSMLARMGKDILWWAERTNASTTLELAGLRSLELEAFFSSGAGPEQEQPIREALTRLTGLLSDLERVRQGDADYVTQCVPLVLDAANYVGLGEASSEARHEKVKFVLKRFSRQECTVWLEFLYGALLSSQCSSDLTALNPHLPDAVGGCLLQLVTIAILRANRIGQTNRCIGAVKQLTTLLSKQLSIVSPAERTKGRTSVMPKISQHAEAILGQLSAKRHFMEAAGGEPGSFSFDPRFLVFEFTWNIMLRKKQIEIVIDRKTTSNQ